MSVDNAANSPGPPGGLLFGDPSVELSSNRTSLSLERTRMSTDRTLMSVIRTSLSLISFGFTIFQVFRKLAQQPELHGAVPVNSARNFGMSLVLLGVGLLAAGLFSHRQLISELRNDRGRLLDLGLLHEGPRYRTSPTAVVALLLLLIGLVALLGMFLRLGPFG